MNRPIHFHINSTSVIRLVKQDELSFSSTEINKQLPALVCSVLTIRFKFRRKFQLLPQIRCLIFIRVESSTISIDSNNTYNIFRKAINVQQGKCKTKNKALKNKRQFAVKLSNTYIYVNIYTYLPTYLLTYLPACLPACLPIYKIFLH